MLKAAANMTKAAHFELDKVRHSAGANNSEQRIHLWTQRDASPGGGGCKECSRNPAVSDSFSCALARRPRAETSHTGRSCHAERICCARSMQKWQAKRKQLVPPVDSQQSEEE